MRGQIGGAAQPRASLLEAEARRESLRQRVLEREHVRQAIRQGLLRLNRIGVNVHQPGDHPHIVADLLKTAVDVEAHAKLQRNLAGQFRTQPLRLTARFGCVEFDDALARHEDQGCDGLQAGADRIRERPGQPVVARLSGQILERQHDQSSGRPCRAGRHRRQLLAPTGCHQPRRHDRGERQNDGCCGPYRAVPSRACGGRGGSSPGRLGRIPGEAPQVRHNLARALVTQRRVLLEGLQDHPIERLRDLTVECGRVGRRPMQQSIESSRRPIRPGTVAGPWTSRT